MCLLFKMEIDQSIDQFIKVIAWDLGCIHYPSQTLRNKTHDGCSKRDKINSIATIIRIK